VVATESAPLRRQFVRKVAEKSIQRRLYRPKRPTVASGRRRIRLLLPRLRLNQRLNRKPPHCSPHPAGAFFDVSVPPQCQLIFRTLPQPYLNLAPHPCSNPSATLICDIILKKTELCRQTRRQRGNRQSPAERNMQLNQSELMTMENSNTEKEMPCQGSRDLDCRGTSNSCASMNDQTQVNNKRQLCAVSSPEIDRPIDGANHEGRMDLGCTPNAKASDGQD
jgi:hypothetical protein